LGVWGWGGGGGGFEPLRYPTGPVSRSYEHPSASIKGGFFASQAPVSFSRIILLRESVKTID